MSNEPIKPERYQHRIDRVVKTAAEARDIVGQEASNILATCETLLRRAMSRAKALEDAWRLVEVPQHFGPTIEFTGRLICETSFPDRREGRQVTLELYETRAGALVAVRAFQLLDGDDSEEATVVIPTADLQADRFAVMAAFKWHTEAKKMVRNRLGWDLRVEVE